MNTQNVDAKDTLTPLLDIEVGELEELDPVYTDEEHEAAKLTARSLRMESVAQFTARGGQVVKLGCIKQSNVIDLYSEAN